MGYLPPTGEGELSIAGRFAYPWTRRTGHASRYGSAPKPGDQRGLPVAQEFSVAPWPPCETNSTRRYILSSRFGSEKQLKKMFLASSRRRSRNRPRTPNPYGAALFRRRPETLCFLRYLLFKFFSLCPCVMPWRTRSVLLLSPRAQLGPNGAGRW